MSNSQRVNICQVLILWFVLCTSLHQYLLEVLLHPCKQFSDHNISHIYVKSYIIPDQKKATKRKTSLLKLGPKSGGRSSSDSVTTWDSEENVHGKHSGKRMGQRLASSLKRGTRFSSKKKKDRDQGNWLTCNFPILRVVIILCPT